MSICCVVGLGYIGLPTAAVLASAGHTVIGVDVNPEVIATVNDGRIHIEPDLDEAVASVVASDLLLHNSNCVPLMYSLLQFLHHFIQNLRLSHSR